MLLSIIIPLYNVENYISQCLQSIIDQKLPYEDYEIIIINDGSIDNSYNVAKKFAENYAHIHLYDQENRGVSATRNKGIDLAKGNYLWFVDSDDYISTNTIDKLITITYKHELDIVEFGMVRSQSRSKYLPNKQIDTSSEITIFNGKEYISSKNFNDSSCVYLFKRKFIVESDIRFFEGKTICEDMLFNAMIIPHVERIAYIPADIYRYVINPNSAWTRRDSKAFRKSIYDLVFIASKYAEITYKYQDEGFNITILKSKLQNVLFNIPKRLLISDLSIYETNKIIKSLSSSNIYPMDIYKGKDKYRKYLTVLFNMKYIFLTISSIYVFFKKPIEYLVINRYYKKREKSIENLFPNS